MTISYGIHTIDFQQHNAEVRELWEAYRAGDPPRAPIVFGINPRLLLQDPKVNTNGTTFREYILDPDVMFDTQLRHQYYVRSHIPQDQEMGLPEAPASLYFGRCDAPADQATDLPAAWKVYVDFQNVYEGAWLGCPVEFPGENEAPYCVPILSDDNRNMLFDRGIPDPIKDGGWMERNFEIYERLRERAKKTVFMGRPVSDEVDLCGTGTDGPFTLYCELRGAEKACMDILLDPEYFHQLMDFITESIVTRITAYRRFLGEKIVQETFSFADDSVELLSLDMYREHILPAHRKLVDTFATGHDNSIHLCGDVSRLLKTIKDELDVLHYDTGFPMDHGAVRRELGPEVEIFGGPSADLFLGETKPLLDETKRILDSGIREGKKFVLREANNLPPRSRMENLWAFYFHGREWGCY